MRKFKIRKNDAGFTLIELVFAAGVMTIGMVLMMQAVISLSHQSKVTDARVAATHFSHSILESMNGRELGDVLQYNANQGEFVLSENGTVLFQGVGDVTVNVYAVITGGTSTIRASIPISDADLAKYTAVAPNPIEIQVEILMDAGMGDGNEFKFRTSTFVYTL